MRAVIAGAARSQLATGAVASALPHGHLCEPGRPGRRRGVLPPFTILINMNLSLHKSSQSTRVTIVIIPLIECSRAVADSSFSPSSTAQQQQERQAQQQLIICTPPFITCSPYHNTQSSAEFVFVVRWFYHHPRHVRWALPVAKAKRRRRRE